MLLVHKHTSSTSIFYSLTTWTMFKVDSIFWPPWTWFKREIHVLAVLKANENGAKSPKLAYPQKIGLHAFHVNLYLHEFIEPTLFFWPPWTSKGNLAILKESNLQSQEGHMHKTWCICTPHQTLLAWILWARNRKEQNVWNQKWQAHQTWCTNCTCIYTLWFSWLVEH